jgi:uncharacterized protein involved in exopolysaccharide biosynthesis
MASVPTPVSNPGFTEPNSPPPSVPGEVELGEVLRKLWRHKGMIVGVTAALTVVAVLVILQITNLYTAESMVMINARETQGTGRHADRHIRVWQRPEWSG